MQTVSDRFLIVHLHEFSLFHDHDHRSEQDSTLAAMLSTLPIAILMSLLFATVTLAAPDAAFGSCSTPQIKFAAGLDGRRETAFTPVDQSTYLFL